MSPFIIYLSLVCPLNQRIIPIRVSKAVFTEAVTDNNLVDYPEAVMGTVEHNKVSFTDKSQCIRGRVTTAQRQK